MTRDEILKKHGFNLEAQARARSRRIEITLWKLGHRAALILSCIALAPASKPILDAFTRAIPLRCFAVLLYTYLIVVLTRWSLPLLLFHLSRMDARDGLREATRRPLLEAMTRFLLVMFTAIPFFALDYGLSFSPWQKTDWDLILYVIFVGVVKLFLSTPYKGRPADETLRRRAEELGKRIKVKPPRLKYLEVPNQAQALGNAAYVRISLWDAIVLTQNLCNRLAPEELDVVLAHELAHRKEWWAPMLIFGARVFALALFVGPLLPQVSSLFGIASFGIETLPIFVALCEVGLLLVSPLERGVTRWAERRADRLALKATGDPKAFASVMVKLYDGNLIDATPGKLWQLLFGTHPTGLQRLEILAP